jgi:hypothetical protein
MSNPKTPQASGSLDRLVRLCVANHTPEELALGWLRYEALRRVNPLIFAEMNRRNLAGEFFDDIVTEALLSWKSPEPNVRDHLPRKAGTQGAEKGWTQ